MGSSIFTARAGVVRGAGALLAIFLLGLALPALAEDKPKERLGPDPVATGV